jgi:hypothetical protein
MEHALPDVRHQAARPTRQCPDKNIENNPMQSSRRHACNEKQFDTPGKSAAFLHHPATL